MRLDNRMLGNSNSKNSWQDLTISILLVLQSFIKNLLIVKSSERYLGLNEFTNFQAIQ